ncbi:Fms-interacting protein-domain-containing protein [Podospora fimiseda]|uniref:Fms-interacting protein-domain-containing protein n=1 Tax=Podospora fimiseda TaxID=252190 RepID=A0AAN7BY44_9PEZI|nr:Fms-interacting protein-domain-containing protein [Podospora fimiseda]
MKPEISDSLPITDPVLQATLEISKSAREQAQAVVDLYAKSLEDASGGAIPVEVLGQLSKEQKLLMTYLAQLRGLHRNSHLRHRKTKTQTLESKGQVDSLHLHLQNLLYEQRHLEGEIAACEGFEHTYQSLPLIPVEEFLAQHPELQNSADIDEDALMVARINHERAEREALEQQRLELQKRKTKLISENKKRREDLANLDKDLEKFIDAAKPIQKMFDKVA